MQQSSAENHTQNKMELLKDPAKVYLVKKELLLRCIRNEMITLYSEGNLSDLGFPFCKLESERTLNLSSSLPIFHFFFQRFIRTYPFLRDVDEIDFWHNKARPLFMRLLDIQRINNISNTTEIHDSHRILRSLEKICLIFLTICVNTRQNEHKPSISNIRQILSQKGFVLGQTTTNSRHRQITVPFYRILRLWPSFPERYRYRFIISKGMGKDYLEKTIEDFYALRADIVHQFSWKKIPHLKYRKVRKILKLSDSSSFGTDQICKNVQTFLRILDLDEQIRMSRPWIAFMNSGKTNVSPEELRIIAKQEEYYKKRSKWEWEISKLFKIKLNQIQGDTTVSSYLIRNCSAYQLFQSISESATPLILLRDHKALIEWLHYRFAYTLYVFFIEHDQSFEHYTQLRAIHSKIPYFLIKITMRVYKPDFMMKSLANILLSRPFGSTSVFQRILKSFFSNEIKELDSEIRKFEEMIGNKRLCRSLKDQALKEDRVDIFEKCINSHKIDRIRRFMGGASEIHPEFIRELNQTDADKIISLINLRVRKRKLDQLFEVLLDKDTTDLLRELITIFFKPLSVAYKDAKAYEFVPVLSRFISDLLTLIERIQKKGPELKPTAVFHKFRDLLIEYGEPGFLFLHRVYSSDDSLFKWVSKWIDSIFNILQTGFSKSIDLEGLFSNTSLSYLRRLNLEIENLRRWDLQKREWRIKKKIFSTQGNMETVTNFDNIDESSDEGLGDSLVDIEDNTNDNKNFQDNRAKFLSMKLQKPKKPQLYELYKADQRFQCQLRNVLTNN